MKIKSSIHQLSNLDIDGDLLIRIKISGNILKNPYFDISLYGKDLIIKNFPLRIVSINLKGHDLKNLSLSLSGKYNNSLFLGKGKLNILNMNGEVEGRLSFREEFSFNSLFYFKGDFSSWKLKFYTKIGSLKYKDFEIKVSNFDLNLDSSGSVDGYFLSVDKDCFLNAKIEGDFNNWKISFWGENIDFLGGKVKKLKLTMDNKFSGEFYSELDNIGSLEGNFVFSLEKGNILLENLLINKNKLGYIHGSFRDNKFNIDGQILEGSIKGYYDISGDGNIDFNDIKLLDFELSGNVLIKGNKVLFKIPKLDFYGMNIEDIKATLDLSNSKEIKDISFIGPYSLEGVGKFSFDSVNLKGEIFIYRERNEFVKLSVEIEKDNMKLNGDILGGKLAGNVNLKEKEVKIICENLDLSSLNDYLGKIDQLEIDFANEGINFSGVSKTFSIRNINLNNVVFKGTYKDLLKFQIVFDYSLVNLKIDGVFDLKGNNDFNLYINSKISLLNSSFIGKVNKDLDYINLKIDKHNVFQLKDLIANISLKEGEVFLRVYLEEAGKIEGNIDFSGNGFWAFENINLSFLKNMNIDFVSGMLSGNMEMKSFQVNNVKLNTKDVVISGFMPFDISMNIYNIQNRYLLRGTISRLSKDNGEIKGEFSLNDFTFNISLPDIFFINSLLPKGILKSGDITKGELRVSIKGNKDLQSIEGDIKWKDPIVVNYIEKKFKYVSFDMIAKNGEILLNNLNLGGDNNNLILKGKVYPNIMIKSDFSEICFCIPDMAKGYLSGDLMFYQKKDRYILSGNCIVFNTHVKYPQLNTQIPNISLPLDFDLKISFKDNVMFYENEFLYLSIKGDLAVKGNSAKPILDGKLSFNSGNINVLGNSFIVNNGYIKFPGLSFEENIWEISASTIIQGYIIYLKGYSFMGNNSFVFSSDPPLTFREILFLLVGQKNLPIAQSETWTLSSIIESIPIGVEGVISSAFGNFILNPIVSEISNIFSLDSLKVDYEIQGLLPIWKSLTLEKRIWDRLYFTLNYSLGGDRMWSGEFSYKLSNDLKFKLYTSQGKQFNFNMEYSTKF